MSKLAWPQSFTAAKKFLNDNGTLKQCPGCEAKDVDFTKVKTKSGEPMFVWQCEDCGAKVTAVAAADKKWSLMSNYKKAQEESGNVPTPAAKKQKVENAITDENNILKEILESEKKLSALIKSNQKENFKLLTGITNLLQVRLDQYSAPSSEEKIDFRCDNEELEEEESE